MKKMSESSLPSSLPNQFESCVGSFVSLITTYNIRYEGVIYHLDLYDSTLVLGDVICYGTEGRNKNGVSSPPVNEVRTYIHFSIPYIKEILVLPHRSYTARCGYGRRGATSTKPSQAKKPPLPTCENIIITQATTDPVYSYVKGLGNDISYTSAKLRLVPRSNHVYKPCDALNEAPIAPELFDSNLMFASTNPPQSFFTTFPPAPISLQKICGGFEFEAKNKNMEQYDKWGGEEDTKPAYSIEGSFYMISRKPFEPIGRPYNPLGPIARPVKHTKETGYKLQKRHQLQQPPPIQYQRCR